LVAKLDWWLARLADWLAGWLASSLNPALPSFSISSSNPAFHPPSPFVVQIALITFLYVDFLDATGTFYSMANFLGNYVS
jgi:hypothetical protein